MNHRTAQEDRLLRVRPHLMPPEELALHRAFTTAWRLLEVSQPRTPRRRAAMLN
jgi:hypothetical protein